MSGLLSITYQSIVDTTKTWVKANCTNITNYAGMSNAVKNGYSYQVGSSGNNTATNWKYYEYAKGVSTSSITAAVAASTVDSNMTNFLTTIGVNSFLSRRISDDNFLRFINDVVCFCTNRLAYVANNTGNASNSVVRYLVYNPGTSWNYSWNITNTTYDHATIYAWDVQTLINYIVDSTSQNLRVLPCRYTFSINN